MIKKLIKNNFLNYIKNNSNAHTEDIIYLGSNYGGWYLRDTKSLYKSTIISAGVGEDISFDIELINRYKTKNILVDPTPRSISYLEDVFNNLGKSKKTEYSQTGYQPFDSYEMTNINRNNLRIIKKALWFKNDKVKFYEPPNPNYVSYSLSNWQNNYSKKTNFIEVSTITIKNILDDEIKDGIELLKLDIEGAEVKVLSEMLILNIYPNQILVEFDELHTSKIKVFIKVRLLIKQLLKKYVLIDINDYPNFLFIKKVNVY